MAGIGFELRKILKEDSLISIFKVYGYSAVLSAGSWIISILSIIVIGIVNIKLTNNYKTIIQFQVVITYLIAFSLIYSGFFQLSFTRYISDKLFEKDYYRILPNYLGVLSITIVLGLIFTVTLSVYLFPEVSNLFRVTFVSSFIVLSCIWISNSLLLGLKEYKKITFYFFLGYLIILILSIFTREIGLEGYIASFFIGNSFIFFAMFSLILKNYKSNRFLEFDFITNKKHIFYWSIAFSGLFYNLAIWADKFVFWFNKETSNNVIGLLRASVLYDLPIFLAYLSIIPGTAIFFYRLEADFAEKYDILFDAIRTDGTYEQIIKYKDEINEVIKMAIKETIIVQGIFNILLYIFSDKIFGFLNLPITYTPLFFIDLVAVQLQLCLMVVLSILYYMNRRKESLWVTIIFLLTNIILSQLSIKMGFMYYGYGFGLSSLISFTFSLILLKRSIDELEYETYCLIN
ncbi:MULTISPECIES: exopolysaccharide Pel transporter PelG [Calditerrivibrio]|uniref:exopolysaccharide Pel transporter PelG n=1 Tax=Calditerrivibrio TaxID=545865 RepID=UPI003C73DCE6